MTKDKEFFCSYCGKQRPSNHSSPYCLTHEVPCVDCGETFVAERRFFRENLPLACSSCRSKRHSELKKKMAKEGKIGFARKENQEAARDGIRRKYGVDNVSQHPDIRKKIENTMIERYGDKSPFSSPEIQEKIAQTNIERYGAANPFQVEKFQRKSRNTMIEKYGADSAMRVPEIKQRQEETLFKNYGVRNPLQSPEIAKRVQSTVLERYGETNFSKTQISRERHRARLQQFTDEEFKDLVIRLATESDSGLIYPEEIREHTDYTVSHIYKKARTLGLNDYVHYSGESQINIRWKLILEKELGVRLSTEGSIFSDKRWKCDLYSEEHRIAVDINPTISHSTQKAHPVYAPKTTMYHQKRALDAEVNGWLLYQIYDWTDEDLVVQQLRNLFGLNSKRVFARKCALEKVSAQEAIDFLNEHHLQGAGSIGSLNYGLRFDGDLVQVMSFSKGRFRNARAEYELLRLASDGTVVGGASRLFKAFVNEVGPKSVMSYASLDTGHGKIYEKLGFKFVGLAGLNALYAKPHTTEAIKVTSCSKRFRKEYEALGLSQQEFMNHLGFFRINDAGSKIFVWRS